MRRLREKVRPNGLLCRGLISESCTGDRVAMFAVMICHSLGCEILVAALASPCDQGNYRIYFLCLVISLFYKYRQQVLLISFQRFNDRLLQLNAFICGGESP